MTITLRKTSESGRHYYYTIHDRQSGLFEPYTLTVVWGPRPDRGRRKIFSFPNREMKDRALRKMIVRRITCGYRVFYSYARKSHYLKIFAEFSGGYSDRRRRTAG
jgi:predicted DNA-binding WGR domain protein